MRYPTVAFLAVVLAVVFSMPTAEAAGLFARLRGNDTASGGTFPETDDLPGLVKLGKVVTYRGKNFLDYYGSQANRFLQYGMQTMKTGDYDYEGEGRRVVIEIATMESVDRAAGLFHYHRGHVLGNKGKDVNIGIEGVVDVERGGRNIYFYKSNLFVKIVYSGKMPIPDLTPIAKAVDSNISAGRAQRPEGFKYIDIQGVDMRTVGMTPGYTFSSEFLPASVWANAPGAGSSASDLFIITRRSSKEAAAVYKDYTGYMRTLGKNFDQFKRGKQNFTQGVDPVQGRVIFTTYKNAVIIVARPDGYEKGEAMIQKVMAKIDAEKGK